MEDLHTGFKGDSCAGVKQGRFVILRFPLFYSICGSQDAKMLGKTAPKVSLSRPFFALSARRNYDLRAVSPNARRQSTGTITNRPHFAYF